MSHLTPRGRERRSLLAAGIVLGGSLLGASALLSREGAYINSPDQGTELGSPVTMRGGVYRRSAEGRFWVTVSKPEEGLYYPQEGPVHIIPGHAWGLEKEWVRTRVTFSKVGLFVVNLFEVSSDGNSQFIDYLKKGWETKDYQPFREYQLQPENGFYLKDSKEVIRRA